MGQRDPADLPRIHGKYRIKPAKEQPETEGRRKIPARPGMTYVLLWNGCPPTVLKISDTGERHYVGAIPNDAKLARDEFLDHDGFNRDGAIPHHVCEFIKFALEIQKERIPRTHPRKKSRRCSCEACQLEKKTP